MNNPNNLSDLLNQYIDGDLSGEQLENVETAISSDARARSLYQELKEIKTGLSGLVVTPPANLSEAIFDKIAKKKRKSLALSRYILPTLAAAAVLLVILAAQPGKNTLTGHDNGDASGVVPINGRTMSVQEGSLPDQSLAMPLLPYHQEFSFRIVMNGDIPPELENYTVSINTGFSDLWIETGRYQEVLEILTRHNIPHFDYEFQSQEAECGILIILD